MESYFFRVLPSTFLLTWSNSWRAITSAQEQEDRRWRRNKRDRAQRAAETAEQRSKGWKSGGRGIMSGTLLKLLVKNKLLHSGKVPVNAELRPLMREKWGTEVQRYGTLKEAWRCDGITFNFHTVTHVLFIHTCPFLAQATLGPMMLKD